MPVKMSEQERKEITEKALALKGKEGFSNRKIAAELGVSPTTINRLLRPQEPGRTNPVKTRNHRPWLHEVQTVGLGLIRWANSLWPPTKIPEEK